MNPFDDFDFTLTALNAPPSGTQNTLTNGNKASRELQLEAELAQTNKRLQTLEKKFNALMESRLSVVEKKEKPPPKAIIQRLEEKINALEERLSKTDAQCALRLSIVSYKNKLFNLACEEILFHNERDPPPNYNVTPTTIYLGGSLFDEVHACISHYVNSQVASRTIQRGGKPDQFPGENTIEFIRQFTNIQRVIIHINCDLPSCGEFGGSRQLDNLMYAIQNVFSFKNGYDIIIKGRYSNIFHNKLLTEMLKLNNYKRVEFDVDQTTPSGTYCDYWKLFMINGKDGRKLMKELQTHCEKHNIGFLSNIM